MKKQTLAVSIIAASLLFFVSCEWFSSHHKTENNFVGKWYVDSMYPTGQDTNIFRFYFFAMSKKDKDSGLVQFNLNNTFRQFNSTDSMIRSYHFTKDSLFMQSDSSYNAFKFYFVNDSVLKLTEKDSTVMILKKQ